MSFRQRLSISIYGHRVVRRFATADAANNKVQQISSRYDDESNKVALKFISRELSSAWSETFVEDVGAIVTLGIYIYLHIPLAIDSLFVYS